VAVDLEDEFGGNDFALLDVEVAKFVCEWIWNLQTQGGDHGRPDFVDAEYSTLKVAYCRVLHTQGFTKITILCIL